VLEICEIGEQGGLVTVSFMLVLSSVILAVINSSTSLMNSRL
jgi:hypothetical protein